MSGTGLAPNHCCPSCQSPPSLARGALAKTTSGQSAFRSAFRIICSPRLLRDALLALMATAGEGDSLTSPTLCPDCQTKRRRFSCGQSVAMSVQCNQSRSYSIVLIATLTVDAARFRIGTLRLAERVEVGGGCACRVNCG